MSEIEKISLKLLSVVKHPIVTEKSTTQKERDQLFFAVSMDATKPQIKEAVEAFFELKVKSVNTLVRKGKKKIFKGHPGRQSDTKRAMVTLMPGQSFDTEVGA